MKNWTCRGCGALDHIGSDGVCVDREACLKRYPRTEPIANGAMTLTAAEPRDPSAPISIGPLYDAGVAAGMAPLLKLERLLLAGWEIETGVALKSFWLRAPGLPPESASRGNTLAEAVANAPEPEAGT